MNDENQYRGGPAAPRAAWRTDDEALAYYLLAPRYGTVPDSVRVELEQIQAAVHTDPELARRVRRMQSRLETMNAGDEVAAFERMTGHRLADLRPRHPVSGQFRARQNRGARRPALWKSPAFLSAGAVATAGIFVAIGALLLQNPTYGDLIQRQHDAPPLEQQLVLRGEDDPTEDAAHVRYRYARALLESAEKRTLWVVRRYDREKLVEALTLFQEASRSATPDAPIYAAIHFHIAKVYLALESPVLASASLRAASAGTGPYASAARDLAARLD